MGGPPLRLRTGGYTFSEAVAFHDDVKAFLFRGSSPRSVEEKAP